MTILFYILFAMLTALTFAGGALAAFKAGEKDLICKYNNAGEDEKQC